MKTIFRLLTIGFLIMAMNNFVSATPSTQIWIPSTDVQGFGVFHLGWDSYIKTESNPMAAEATGYTRTGYGPTVTNGGITVGVLPFKKIGLEIGIDYRDISSNHQNPLYFNAKLGVPEDAFFKYMPAVAIGGFDLGTETGNNVLTNYNITYGLIAKNIWKLGRVSVGYYGGNDRALMVAKKESQGVLVSWDRTLTEISDKLWLAVEYMGAKNGYGEATVGGSYAITPDASFIIGYDYWNDYNSYRPTVTVQIDMNLPAVQDWFKKPDKKQ